MTALRYGAASSCVRIGKPPAPTWATNGTATAAAASSIDGPRFSFSSASAFTVFRAASRLALIRLSMNRYRPIAKAIESTIDHTTIFSAPGLTTAPL